MAEQSYNSKVKIFALNSNKPLAKKIADAVGVPLGKTSVNRFSDGEIRINIEESIRGDEIFIIQSTSAPVNDNLMELLIMIDAKTGKCINDQRCNAILWICTARPESAFS